MNCFKFKLNRKSSIVKRNSIESTNNDSIIQSLQNENIEEDRFSSQNDDFIEIENKQEEISLEFKHSDLKYFLEQNIHEIRLLNKVFEDTKFIRYISSIVETTESGLGLSLVSRFKTKNLDELNHFIKWQRTQALAESLKEPKTNEFVLDDSGQPPLKSKQAYKEHLKYFSAYDIYQGWMGNCFHVGALMAFTQNDKLLDIIIPSDNLDRENIKLGAYHFRFWKLGYWYDVLIDDFLPTNDQNELIFSYNKIFSNEFWVPLFEKAFAKFLGNYDELEKGVFENSALFLSGGIHDQYLLKEVVSNVANVSMPNKNELFEIIQIALLRKDLVGCVAENEDIARKFGIVKEHLYLVNDTFTKESKKYIKIHNPFNTTDGLKDVEDYLELEKKLCEYGLKATQPGEFWVNYDNFIESFRRLAVCNLQPFLKFTTSDIKYSKSLKQKTNLLTKWKVTTFRGILPAKARQIHYYHADYTKYKIKINGTSDLDLIISFVQDWLKTHKFQIVNLHIYVYDPKNEDWVSFKHETYESSLQWCLRLSLKPGFYLLIFESGLELITDLKYCFRIFANSNDSRKLKVDEFNQEPRFDPIIV